MIAFLKYFHTVRWNISIFCLVLNYLKIEIMNRIEFIAEIDIYVYLCSLMLALAYLSLLHLNLLKCSIFGFSCVWVPLTVKYHRHQVLQLFLQLWNRARCNSHHDCKSNLLASKHVSLDAVWSIEVLARLDIERVVHLKQCLGG
jgi:hypothetical protein